jgi:hypothetical protein
MSSKDRIDDQRKDFKNIKKEKFNLDANSRFPSLFYFYAYDSNIIYPLINKLEIKYKYNYKSNYLKLNFLCLNNYYLIYNYE